MALGTLSGSLVELHDVLIMKPFPHLLLQVEVMVNVEDQAFPLLVIVVIRVLLVTFCDVAIGTHPVTEMQGSQQQEGSCCGSVQPPVGLLQIFRF